MPNEFLEGCKKRYQCGQIMLPIDGWSFAPFVELNIDTPKFTLTVGNMSQTPQNNAVIKSFEYGGSSGMGATIEILDEQGGNFTKSMESLNKSMGAISKDMKSLRLDFGWIRSPSPVTGEAGEKISVKTESKDSIYLLPLNMMVVYEGGKIKYTIEAKDPCSRVGEARMEKNIGRDDAKVPLKQAIREFLSSKPDPIFKVEFWAASRGFFGGRKEWEFKKSEGGDLGPKGVWHSGQQNKLATLRRWLANYSTSNDKGIIITYKGKDESTLILQEDPTDKCGNFDPCNSTASVGSVGTWPRTYIVNGGKQSPVLSFNPQVKWTFTGGGTSGGKQSSTSGKGVKEKGKPCNGKYENEPGSGPSKKTQDRDPSKDGSVDSSQKSSDANSSHEIANAFREQLASIEAELKIIGDPTLAFPIDTVSKYIQLIVINPFHIKRFSETNFGWLSDPLCNPVFSNKAWRITGVNHQIKEGSYITIIKIMLDVPNVQLPPGYPLGGLQGGGYVFPYQVSTTKE